MYGGSRIIEYAPSPLHQSQFIGSPIARQSYVPPMYNQPMIGQPLIGQPLISQSYMGSPMSQSYVGAPIIRQSYMGQQAAPQIIEEHRETTTTEEFIPAPPMMMVQQQQIMNSQMMQQQRPPWFGRTLLIRPVAAQLTHNTDFFLLKMDPFVEIVVGPARYKTTVHKNGGKRPQWNETFSHQLFGGESEMAIIVWDQDRRKADLVGETRINLAQVLAHGSSSNWYELFWRGKSAGRVLINMEIV